MECFKPGEVVIQPIEGGRSFLENQGYDLLYSAEDVIEYYNKEKGLGKNKFYSFPAIVKVPEGKEQELSIKYRSNKNILAALPNFLIRPSNTELTINEIIIDETLRELNCIPNSQKCGNNVKIAILDSGIDNSFLPYPNSVFNKQFSTHTPNSNLDLTDGNGHGTLVAYIINLIAPGAEIFSIKVFDEQGTIGGLLSGFYLAETEFQPDIYNLSLGINCSPRYCSYCGNNEIINSQQLELLFNSIDKQRNSSNLPLIVAAGGNKTESLMMPASFDNVLAVGSYVHGSSFHSYSKINPKKFILAPGGSENQNNCLGYKSWFNQNHFLEGTSFSAAFVSGISARFQCSKKDNSPCKDMIPNPSSGRKFLLECLDLFANKSFNNYDSRKHGMGIVNYYLKNSIW